MQAYKDLHLKCGDCKNTVSSAALLLRHFAQHITDQHETDKSSVKRERTRRNILYKKKKKKKSILESVLQVFDPTTVSSPSGGTNSSTVSAFSDYQESSNDNSSLLPISLKSLKSPTMEENNVNPNENVSASYQPSLSLVRFDLQQRLEDCVMNLSNKKVKLENNNCKLEKHINVQNIKKEIEVVDIPHDASMTNEEFNPLKFCMITMEEKKYSSKNLSKETKKVSNRKQLVPKKIEQTVRKLAPKPNNQPKSQNNNKLSHKKKYPCHLCNKVFGWSTDLKRHILVHTGERPFKCKTCLASFTRNFLLQKHQSKVHPCSPPKKRSLSPANEARVKHSDTLKTSPIEVQQQTVMVKIEKSESDDDIDEDEDRLVITEPFEDEETNNAFSNTVDSKWTTISSSSDRRCLNIELPDMFSLGQVKVVTI